MRKERKLPVKKNYDGFVEEFSDMLGRKYPEICFFLYGSYTDDRLVSGRSDLDGSLILDAEFITPKHMVMDIAGILARCLSRNRIPIQFNLMDRATNRDGRFLSYTTDFTEWFKTSPIIMFGSDYLKEMHGLDFKSGALTTIAFNLRGVRNRLLESLDDLAEKPERFKENFVKSLDKVSGLPKKLVYLQTGEVIAGKTESMREFKRIFTQFDSRILEKAISLLHNPRALFNYAEDTENALHLWQDALTAMETMVKMYAQKFPRISNSEVARQGR